MQAVIFFAFFLLVDLFGLADFVVFLGNWEISNADNFFSCTVYPESSNVSMIALFTFLASMHNAAECYQQLWGGRGGCRRVFQIRLSSSLHVRITECCTSNRHWKTPGAPLFRFVFRFAGLKPWSELYGKASILIRIADCWYSSYFLLSSRNPKTNWCLSRIYGVRFGEKDRGLSTCKSWP